VAVLLYRPSRKPVETPARLAGVAWLKDAGRFGYTRTARDFGGHVGVVGSVPPSTYGASEVVLREDRGNYVPIALSALDELPAWTHGFLGSGGVPPATCGSSAESWCVFGTGGVAWNAVAGRARVAGARHVFAIRTETSGSRSQALAVGRDARVRTTRVKEKDVLIT